MAQEISPEPFYDIAFKALLKPDAPPLTGRANWDAWSQAMEKYLNLENLYFALHEQAPYELGTVPNANDLRGSPLVRTWVQQTQDDEMVSATPKVQREAYAQELLNDVQELASADEAAMEMVLGRIHEEVRQKIPPSARKGSVKNLWAELERMHIDTSLDDVDTAIARLERLCKNPNLSVEIRLAEMTTIRDDLASWGVELPDAYLAALFWREVDQSLREAHRGCGCSKMRNCSWDRLKICFSSKGPSQDEEQAPRAESAKSDSE